MTKTNGSAPPPEAHEDGEEPFDQERAELLQERAYNGLYEKFLREVGAQDPWAWLLIYPSGIKHLVRLAYFNGMEDMREIMDNEYGEMSAAFYHELRDEVQDVLHQMKSTKNRSAAQANRKRKRKSDL
jgi:ketol-acid reductoisomerase